MKNKLNVTKLGLPILAASTLALGIGCGRLANSPFGSDSDSATSQNAATNSGTSGAEREMKVKLEVQENAQLGLVQEDVPNLIGATWKLHHCKINPVKEFALGSESIDAENKMDATVRVVDDSAEEGCIFSLESFQLQKPNGGEIISYYPSFGSSVELFGDGGQTGGDQSASPLKGLYNSLPSRDDGLQTVALYGLDQVGNDLSSAEANYIISMAIEGVRSSSENDLLPTKDLEIDSGQNAMVVPVRLDTVVRKNDKSGFKLTFDCLGVLDGSTPPATCAGIDVTQMSVCIIDSNRPKGSDISLSFNQLELIFAAGADSACYDQSTATDYRHKFDGTSKGFLTSSPLEVNYHQADGTAADIPEESALAIAVQLKDSTSGAVTYWYSEVDQ